PCTHRVEEPTIKHELPVFFSEAFEDIVVKINETITIPRDKKFRELLASDTFASEISPIVPPEDDFEDSTLPDRVWTDVSGASIVIIIWNCLITIATGYLMYRVLQNHHYAALAIGMN